MVIDEHFNKHEKFCCSCLRRNSFELDFIFLAFRRLISGIKLFNFRLKVFNFRQQQESNLKTR